MTQRDKWKKRPVIERYHTFCDELRLKANEAGWRLQDQLKIEFLISMPKSWSKKEKLSKVLGPHQQKPDTDNLVKAVLDAMTKYEEGDDSFVWDIHARKYWVEGEGFIRIWVAQELDYDEA